MHPLKNPVCNFMTTLLLKFIHKKKCIEEFYESNMKIRFWIDEPAASKKYLEFQPIYFK